MSEQEPKATKGQEVTTTRHGALVSVAHQWSGSIATENGEIGYTISQKDRSSQEPQKRTSDEMITTTVIKRK